MARTKAFDPALVLDRALALFWKKGFETASLPDLLRHMGISRQSLYDTFGDKQSLFEATLKRYRELTLESLARSGLSNPDAGLAEIRAHFEFKLKWVINNSERRACLMAYTAMDPALKDPEIQKLVKEHFRGVEAAFLNALENAVEAGDITPRENLAPLAMFLTNNLHGLGIMTNAGASRSEMRELVELALGTLR